MIAVRACGLLLVSTVAACGGRTGLEPLAPAAALPDAGTDAASEVECVIPTVGDAVVVPSACEVDWARCRPTVEARVIVPDGCGQSARAAWTGEALLVAYDAIGERGANLALVGLDGRVRSDREITPFGGSSNFGDIAWHPTARRALSGDIGGFAWLDGEGRAVGRSSVLVSAPDVALLDDGFVAVLVEDGRALVARLGPDPSEPSWEDVGPRGVQSAKLVVDATGRAIAIAIVEADARTVSMLRFDGTVLAQSTLDRELPDVLAALALDGGRILVGRRTDTIGEPVSEGYFLEELSADGPRGVRLSTAGSPWGMSLVQLGASPLIAYPWVDGERFAMEIAAVGPDLEHADGAPVLRIEREGYPRGPRLVPTSNGFALLYYVAREGITLDVLECCAP
jgi:hypothetical protein